MSNGAPQDTSSRNLASQQSQQSPMTSSQQAAVPVQQAPVQQLNSTSPLNSNYNPSQSSIPVQPIAQQQQQQGSQGVSAQQGSQQAVSAVENQPSAGVQDDASNLRRSRRQAGIPPECCTADPCDPCATTPCIACPVC